MSVILNERLYLKKYILIAWVGVRGPLVPNIIQWNEMGIQKIILETKESWKISSSDREFVQTIDIIILYGFVNLKIFQNKTCIKEM